MENCLLINGGRKLIGETTVQGSKNCALPLIAAAVRLGVDCTLLNIPDISDVRDFLEILGYYGVEYSFNNNQLKIVGGDVHQPSEVEFEVIVQKSIKIRSSSYLLGALLPRLGELALPKSGGCKLGDRPIDIHLASVVALGGTVKEFDNYYLVTNGMGHTGEIKFRYPSFGATVNTILLTIDTIKDIYIVNVAFEPEINQLISFLNKGGKSVKKQGNCIKVSEGLKNKSVVFYNPYDRIVVGDLLLACAATNGEIQINGVNSSENKVLIRKLIKSTCNFDIKNDIIKCNHIGKVYGFVKTMPYPHFPTDLQAQFACAVCASGGVGVVKELVFGSRFTYAEQLKLMGANLKILHRSLVILQSKLHSAELVATDLRGGAGLVIAGLTTRGYTKVGNLHIIDRGYQDIATIYNNLGADIKRI